jgi:hypothetical protein
MTYAIGNLYSIDGDLAEQVTAAKVHYFHKLGLAADAVLLHPDNVTGETVAGLKVIPDSTQGKVVFMLVSLDKDGQGV